MKTKTISFISLLIICLLITISCQQEKNTGNFTFKTIAKQEKAHLFNNPDKPSCSLSLDFTYINKSANDLLKDSLNNYFISLFFGDTYQNKPLDTIFSEYINEYVQTYKNDLESLYKEDEEMHQADSSYTIGGWYFYEKTLNSTIAFYNQDLLAYQIDYTEYTGGAHGIYATNVYNFDLNTRMILKLPDIFVPNYQESLTEELWNQLMLDNQVSTKEELRDLGFESTGELTPTSNFKLDKEGITFIYNVYEIVPYAMGMVSITIPYSKISHLFNSNPILQSVLN